MNDVESYIFDCLDKNQKIGGRKIKSFGVYPDYQSLFLKYHNTVPPLCKECSNTARFVSITKGYGSYCSKKCSDLGVSRRNSQLNSSRSKQYAEKLIVAFDQQLKDAARVYVGDPTATIKNIASDFNIPYNRLRRYLIKTFPSVVNKRRKEVNQINHDKIFNLIDTKLIELHNINGNNWSSKNFADQLGISRNYVCEFLRDRGTPLTGGIGSGYEVTIEQILIDLQIEFVKNCRQTIKPLELDFFIPKFNLAIEVNGSYFHKDRRLYHLKKTEMCDQLGIRLIHVFDFEITNTLEKVISIIKSAVNKNTKIAARKCNVVELSSTEFNKFCDNHHLQNGVNSSIRLGLKYQNNIVAVMGFSKPRFDKNCDYELTRYCSTLETTIVGGAAKLFKHFTQKWGGMVVSYCQRRIFTGGMYVALGFKLHHKSPPNYFWCNSSKRLSRYQTQKHKLNTGMSENDYMKLQGFHRVYDCGQYVYYYK